MKNTICFGFYPHHLDIENERFSVKTLPDHKYAVEHVLSDSNVINDWIYPGKAFEKNFINGVKKELPYSTRVFGLPKTHVLTLHDGASHEELDFVVWCISFFTGMRLTTTEAGFVDATPIKPGKLVDFVLNRCTLEDAIELVLSYVKNARGQPRALKRVAAIIHSLFLSQYPHSLAFERFQYLYMALDTCYKLLSVKEPIDSSKPNSHAQRIEWMCTKFNIPVPTWAKVDSPKKASQISVVRNDAMHEALFFDEPLGFAVYGGNVRTGTQSSTLLQMQALACRLIIAALGRPEISYVSTPVDTRGIYPLRLI
ncbi:hypothetical protein [Rheinheimera lutimaris]|uniref:hypothetical protein n=1 Tax=Rheinheimera lutimaris TaxID=2740584 RepID=UPI001C49BE70|nr:hypothetical protein [Rheinheimera lutimaris]